MKNDCNVSPTMRSLYSQFCQARDAAAKTEDPKEKAAHLEVVLETASQLIGRLAMLGAGLESILVSLDRNVDKIAQMNPVAFQDVDARIGPLVGLHQFLMQGYSDEAEFCLKFEKLVREKMLTEAGLDPSDIEGSFDYMRKRALVAVLPANPSN